jgi:hypothetical protein
MIGIVWGANEQNAKEQLNKIIEGYAYVNVPPESIQESCISKSIVFTNGDIWRAIVAYENARGYRANISYIDRQISQYLIDMVIKPITTYPPFQAISYYGGCNEDTNKDSLCDK